MSVLRHSVILFGLIKEPPKGLVPSVVFFLFFFSCVCVFMFFVGRSLTPSTPSVFFFPFYKLKKSLSLWPQSMNLHTVSCRISGTTIKMGLLIFHSPHCRWIMRLGSVWPDGQAQTRFLNLTAGKPCVQAEKRVGSLWCLFPRAPSTLLASPALLCCMWQTRPTWRLSWVKQSHLGIAALPEKSNSLLDIYLFKRKALCCL